MIQRYDDNKAMVDRLTQELAEANKSCSQLADGVVRYKAELAEARKATEWTPITPETKFDKSLDYLLGRPLRSSTIIRGDEFQRTSASLHLLKTGWTHYRPINPPAPEGSAKQ